MNWSLNRRLIIAGLALAFALFAYPLVAWAQQEVLLTGQDSSGNTRIVAVDSAGRVSTNNSASHGACVNTTMNVGTTGTACPVTALSARSTVLVQLVQAGETLTVTSDGATAADSAVGMAITSGNTYSDNLVGTVGLSCRCTAATCSVRIVECP